MEKEMSEAIDDLLTELGGINSRRAANIHIEVYVAIGDTWNLSWDVMRDDLTRSGLMQK